ncbi:MAG: carbonic anhydrase [Bacteroidia bacterium]|nr:carbonic anhydrase [Bacteroidia bacterium]
MESHIKLLLNNKIWAQEKLDEDQDYFVNMAREQSPEYLWIGCSDSRVPANEVIGAEPGELFVHRNIANLVVHTDINLLSVLQYAVEQLKVKNIIVCGHYGCGGVKAALENHHLGILNKWLRNIKDVYRLHIEEILASGDETMQLRKLVELNIKEQVLNLAKTSIIQRAWKYEQRPTLHGWVYGLEDGILKEVFKMDYESEIDAIYRYSDI